jgi:hypothetical protein
MKEPGALRGLVFALLTGIIVSFKSNRRRMAGEQDGTGHCTARMSAKGHSRPNHRGPKSTDVCYAPKATIQGMRRHHAQLGAVERG